MGLLQNSQCPLNRQIKDDSEHVVKTEFSASLRVLDCFCPFSSQMAQSHKTQIVLLRTQSARFSNPSPIVLRNYLAQWSANVPPEHLQSKKEILALCVLLCMFFPWKTSLEVFFFNQVLQISVTRQTCIVPQRFCVFQWALALYQFMCFLLLGGVRIIQVLRIFIAIKTFSCLILTC